MKYLILIFVLILLVPLIYSQDCNTECINQGYSSGLCTASCSYIDIEGGDDCAISGEVVLVIGTKAINTYKDLDAFIGEKEEDPEWVWLIQNMKTVSSTNILDTSDETQHTGPILGIKNNFIATDISSTGIIAKKKGESFCFPDNVACIKFIELTVSDYGTYTIQKTTVDLSAFNVSWTNKDAILIKSVDDTQGLELDTADYDVSVGVNGEKTDNIWVIYNSSDSFAAVYYEDSSNTKRLAGYLNMDSSNDDINIADVNYRNTQDTNVQIDLRGDFGTADNLDLVFDIIAVEGAASTNGADDITINLKHSADSDFSGFGNTSGSADDGDLVWTSTEIGTKDEDHRSLYGIIIKNPKANGASDKVVIEVPEDQVKARVEITRKLSSITKIKGLTSTVLGEQIPSPKLASEVEFKEDNHLIFVGGPCANPLVEEFDKFPKCEAWPLKQGEAMIKYAKNGMNIALLVAGTTASDTRMATKFLKSFDQYDLEGTYIKIINGNPDVIISSFEGIDFSDYPFPFIKDEKFQNMLLVVGDQAKAEDTIGAVDIASSLMSQTRNITGTTNIIESLGLDSNITEEIPLGNNLADSNFFSAALTNGDISSIIDSKVFFGSDEYDFHETFMLYNSGPSIETSLSSSDDAYESNVYMEAIAGSLRYYYAFDDKIDITTVSVNSPLTISVLDNSISITSVESATEFKSRTANKYFMDTGEEIKVEGVDVKLVDVAKDGSIKIRINNTDEIVKSGQNKFISGLDVKNLESFDETGTSCCCEDLLNF